jgi:hypothetical protein
LEKVYIDSSPLLQIPFYFINSMYACSIAFVTCLPTENEIGYIDCKPLDFGYTSRKPDPSNLVCIATLFNTQSLFKVNLQKPICPDCDGIGII